MNLNKSVDFILFVSLVFILCSISKKFLIKPKQLSREMLNKSIMLKSSKIRGITMTKIPNEKLKKFDTDIVEIM